MQRFTTVDAPVAAREMHCVGPAALSASTRAHNLTACALCTDLTPMAGRRTSEISMGGEMVLLRVVDEAQEGWKCMPFEEFLERIDLASWKDGQELVGMILPQGRQHRLH